MTIRAREDCVPAVLAAGLPAADAGCIERYIFDRIEPGGFVFAVLSNELVWAAEKADFSNQRLLFEWASLMYNGIPIPLRGSRAIVEAWLTGEKSLEGFGKAD